jgi:hypothetical protein
VVGHVSKSVQISFRTRSFSPLGTVICISPLDLPSNRKKLEFISNPLKKYTYSRFCKPEAPDSSREGEFHVIIFRSIKGS